MNLPTFMWAVGGVVAGAIVGGLIVLTVVGRMVDAVIARRFW